MPTAEIERPFETIESATEYVKLLADTALDSMLELRRDYDLALRNGDVRTARAIELAIFKLKILGCQLFKSRRALNDLRILRRLILNERTTAENVIGTI